MSYRFNWAFRNAFWSVFNWMIIMLVLALVSYRDTSVNKMIALGFLIVLPLPFFYRLNQFYQMFTVHVVYNEQRSMHVMVGHQLAFQESSLGHPQGKYHTVLLDNDMMIVAETRPAICAYHRLLRESLVYGGYFGLLKDCPIVDLSTP